MPAKKNKPKVDKVDTIKRNVIDALIKARGIVTLACENANISRTSFYNWYNNDKEFQKQVDDVGDIALDFVENQLLLNIEDRKEASIIFYMKTKGKKRGYIERQEVTGKDGTKLIDKVIFEEIAVKH